MIPWRELPSVLTASVAGWLAPDTCHLCGCAYDPELRARCPVAPRALPLAGPLEYRAAGLVLRSHPFCARCLGALRPCREEALLGDDIRLCAAFISNETLLGIVHVLKFARVAAVAGGAAGAIAHALESSSFATGERALLVPVPMDRRSRRRRGFNQSEEIARALGHRLGIEVSAQALRKVRRTPPQSLAAAGERARNVDGAFAAAGFAASGRDVVLVDDLVTTGATIRACAAALTGARSVVAASLGYRTIFAPAPRPPASFLQS